MKHLIALLAFLMLSQAQAQQAAYTQAPQAAQGPKKTLIYDERTNTLVEVAPSIQPVAQAQGQGQAQSEATATAVAPSAPAGAPIYILNNQRLQGYQGVSQNAIQDQPTTVVVDAPATASASASYRKQRAETEAGTEDSIVQALEKARMEDEMRRREKFANALAPSVVAQQQQQQQVVVTAPAASSGAVVAQQQQQQQVVAVQPAPAVVAVEQEQAQEVVIVPDRPVRRKKVVVEDSYDRDVEVHNDIRLSLLEREPRKLTNYYISGLVGMGVYPDANMISSALATGFTVGMVTQNNMVVEGAFSYGDYTIGYDQNNYNGLNVDMAQYDFSVALKYQILSGRLRPAVGVIGAYTHRNYTSDMCGFTCGGLNNNNGLSTDAFNAGLTAGVDFALTNNFSVGVDFRYLWSIASRTPPNNNFQATNNNNWGPERLEELSYYMTTLGAKFSF